MFNSKRIKELEKRIAALEAGQTIKSRTQMVQEVQFSGGYPVHYRTRRKIPLADAVQAIVDKMGLAFEYKEVTSEVLELRRARKSSSDKGD